METTNHIQRYENERVRPDEYSNAIDAQVTWAAPKSLFVTTMLIGAILACTHFFSWGAVFVFVVSSMITLCAGHSLGMHRKLIHQSYACSKSLEYIFVYLGTLVGLGGPATMIKTHDMRDWAQRQKKCHAYFGHEKAMLLDYFWQVHCDIHLKNPPQFVYENKVKQSAFYKFLNKTTMLQQLPLACIFYYFGAWEWVCWGIGMRVSVSIFGHWLIGYFAHNQGQQDWLVADAHVQGYNVALCSLITFGESWHNNHHAFPNSAKLSLHSNQIDLGWLVLKLLEKLGLVWQLKTQLDLPCRPELVRVDDGNYETEG